MFKDWLLSAGGGLSPKTSESTAQDDHPQKQIEQSGIEEVPEEMRPRREHRANWRVESSRHKGNAEDANREEQSLSADRLS